MDINPKHFPSVEILRVSDPTNNFLSFAIKSRFKLYEIGFRTGLLVAGDFWVGGLSTLILQRICRVKSRTQITLHGNPLNAAKKRFPAENRLRRLVFQVLLRSFDSIRLVSRNLNELLRFDLERLSKKVLVSPVYMPAVDLVRVSPAGNKSVAVLGRLHSERNPLEALSVIQKVLVDDSSLRLKLVGDGPMRSEVLEFCERELPEDSYAFLGQLPHKEAMVVLASSSVLVSSAIEEGYGLTIREALLLNVPVVARRNKETSELSSYWPEIMTSYGSETEAAELVRGFLTNPPHESQFARYRSSTNLDRDRDLETLTRSWAALTSKQI
ncbi:RfaG Glycosyltransferase [Candidatus Nanopelagicaceae bacterium]